ncbi:MAG TPA: nucleotidyltransferase domain-containing protein [Thermodesulfovibrionales bacterium]|nr:nucleotidyltransferase domain-containing protein [Thermodesulfovibrionales bacterium]
MERILNSAVKRLVENLDVEKIVLFGSSIKGTYTKDSDIDLLVMVNTRKKGIERYAMVSELLEPREIPMDIIVRTPAEIKNRERYFDPFIRNVMSGKVLYEKKA